MEASGRNARPEKQNFKENRCATNQKRETKKSWKNEGLSVAGDNNVFNTNILGMYFNKYFRNVNCVHDT